MGRNHNESFLKDPIMMIFEDDGQLNEKRFSRAAMMVLDQALTEAIRSRWTQIRSPHLGLAIFAHPDSDVSICARNNGIRAENIIKEFRRQFVADDPHALERRELNAHVLSENALECLRQAARFAEARNADQIDERDIWRAILMDPGNFFVQVLLKNGVWPLWLLPFGW